MSNMTLENLSCNCSSRKILFLSHQTKDVPFHVVIRLVASTKIILNNTTLNLRSGAPQQAENLHSHDPMTCQKQ